jgi:hypothetical protein
VAVSVLDDWRNRLDFAIRSRLRFGREVTERSVLASDLAWQEDARAFLFRLPWTRLLNALPDTLEIADVGARTFALAPVLRACLAGKRAHITGIELDAYRRFPDFRTRKDHGEYWAKQVDGAYFAGDVRAFRTPVDVLFLLDPFVSEAPLLAWGLPLTELAPLPIFAHCVSVLKRPGLLVISNPTDDEARISDALLHAQGLKEVHRTTHCGLSARILRVFSAP